MGTLREAIVQANANGATEVDYIYFNLPGNTEEDRTILIASSLPMLSSKIVIDGTSQPGDRIGMSNARIIIKTLRTFDKPDILLFAAKDVEQIELYGIYFLDTTQPNLSYPGDVKRAIDIINAKNIIIGDKGKGNVFNGYRGYWGAVAITKCDGLKIADSYFGVSPYENKLVSTEAVVFEDVNNIELGGPEKGNVIFDTFVFRFTDRTKLFNVDINSNNIAVYKDGLTTEWWLNETYFRIASTYDNQGSSKSKINLKVSDNLFSHSSGSGALEFKNLDGSIRIWHNWFNIDRSGKIELGNKIGCALSAESTNAEIVFGDTDPGLGNIVGYSGGIFNGYASEKIKIIRNSFRCMSGKIYNYGQTKIPYVEVMETTSGHIKGKSSPSAIVDVYLSDDCTSCSPETYLGTTNATTSGEWQFNFATVYARNILVNAHVGNQSSDFSTPQINTAALKITDVDCSNTGKISGVEIRNTDKFKWINEKGDVVSRELELKNAVPGRYKLIVGEFCPTESNYFTIRNLSPVVFANYAVIKQPTCGRSDGSLTNFFASTEDGAILTYSWTNSNGVEVGNTRDVRDLPAGSYTLKASSPKCSTTYGPVTLKSAGSPNIDVTALVKLPSKCNQATGSITNIGISGTGNIVYQWKNEKNEVVGNQKDLSNVVAGKYTLQITDAGGCGPVYSDAIEVIEENGIIIDEIGLSIAESQCKNNNGKISGMKVTGATRFEWLDGNGNVVSNELDLVNVGPGDYYLKAANMFCSKLSAVHKVTLQSSTANFASTKILKDASCGLNNGKISVIFTAQKPLGYRWENADKVTIGNIENIENLSEGTYNLYIIDDLGCERFYLPYTIGRVKSIELYDNGTIVNDECSLGKGSIKGLDRTGGIAPFEYKWLDEDGQVKGEGISLTDVRSGRYQLMVKDANGCLAMSSVYTVGNDVSILASPITKDTRLCGPGKALIEAKGEGTSFRLYDTELSGSHIQEKVNGQFFVEVSGNKSFYVSQMRGECESERKEIKVSVGLSAVNVINSFTPNDDGVNDFWVIKGIENYPQALISVFNRYGKKVFESKGYTSPFDGKVGGELLPPATYYYMINLGTSCGMINGSLTLIR
ncbi:gliding motility-associated C-terminal domain-containing protein [Pedobacter jeongneungensis]|uniref:gliding motility-associated C-terminal domain-containing protein n=1 Tax=Pedobacter jeongneungensis TaxID=947309 RepID=UPI0013B3C3BE|nr:gliding motility-associated C-terminal domain-containing protein [Pedobacter jeongneungensis]